jgi:hypothetical protein
MALNKLKFNSLNVTPTAGKAVGFNSSANGLEATLEGGSMRFIKKLTASSSANLSFVNGSSDVVLDNTYKEYLFIFNNIHPQNDGGYFYVNFSADTGSNYNVTKTTTSFKARHGEDDSGATLAYVSGTDLTQSTGNQPIALDGVGNANDESTSGYLHLFNPSSTTFIKHFIIASNADIGNANCVTSFVAGYCNTTSAIDAVQFVQQSGNLDAGTITLYGIN